MVEQGIIVDYKSVKIGDVVNHSILKWDIGNYYLGRIVNIAPALENVRSCSGDHLHIAVDQRFWDGESVHVNNNMIFPACGAFLRGAMLEIVSPTD